MKPAGRERDIEIAKLKGWKKLPSDETYWLNPEGKIETTGIPPWSTNRHAVWELWDELPKGKDFFIDTDGQCYLNWSMLDDGEWRHQPTQGNDFADCVSQVFITWKETLKEATR